MANEDRVVRTDVGGHIIDNIPVAVVTRTDDERRRFDAAVNERAEVLAKASHVLPAGFKSSLLTVRQIREAALKAAGCTQDFAGKGDDYVHGTFDHYMKPSSSESSPRLDSSKKTNLTWSEAHARLDALNSRTPLPGWTQPLTHTREDEVDPLAPTGPRVPDWQKPLRISINGAGEIF